MFSIFLKSKSNSLWELLFGNLKDISQVKIPIIKVIIDIIKIFEKDLEKLKG